MGTARAEAAAAEQGPACAAGEREARGGEELASVRYRSSGRAFRFRMPGESAQTRKSLRVPAARRADCSFRLISRVAWPPWGSDCFGIARLRGEPSRGMSVRCYRQKSVLPSAVASDQSQQGNIDIMHAPLEHQSGWYSRGAVRGGLVPLSMPGPSTHPGSPELRTAGTPSNRRLSSRSVRGRPAALRAVRDEVKQVRI